MTKHKKPDIYFTDFFEVAPATLRTYGAFNTSLVSDLPLFIDPFLLFNSKNQAYRDLHESIIRYLKFLRDKSLQDGIDRGLLQAWFMFGEVRQTWLGYSRSGNRGSGLGRGFAEALNANLNTIFKNFGREQITCGSHLEKLCLIKAGVGRDNVSDFTTNLIKDHLLSYTERFTREHITATQRRRFAVPRAVFNYATESWEAREYELPAYDDDYVILVPRDMLTKDEVWINRPDLFHDFQQVADTVPNEQLRGQINNYVAQRLSEEPTQAERAAAIEAALQKYPEIIEHYIRYKEDHGDDATRVSDRKVAFSEQLYVHQVGDLVDLLRRNTRFYDVRGGTLTEARERVEYFKDVIEYKGGHRLFYADGQPIRREEDLHILYRLTWFGTPSDVSREVDDGRGPADFKISRGSADKSIVEFKLASNTQLKKNLRKQTELYQKASDAEGALKVIIYFTAEEQKRVMKILTDLEMEANENVILIDGRADNKPSASKAE